MERSVRANAGEAEHFGGLLTRGGGHGGGFGRGRLSGRDAAGRILFSFSFAPTSVAHGVDDENRVRSIVRGGAGTAPAQADDGTGVRTLRGLPRHPG
jgi:hypothetical protein